MSGPVPLIGRDEELATLLAGVDGAARGAGSVLLLSGEAGVGKTRLVAEAAAAAPGTLLLAGSARQGGTEPYAPLVAALRAFLHEVPEGLGDCGPLRSHLARLLPELGEPADAADRATLLEAIRCALAAVTRERPVLLVLDDLHWSDEATLDALAALAGPVTALRLTIVAAYRRDELARDHPLRRLRSELRRRGSLEEIVLEPLPADATAQLAEHVLGGRPGPRLARTIADRTNGLPFFVEELAQALATGGMLRPGNAGLELDEASELPVPATVRDAVLIRAARLSDEAREAAEAAAVVGERFDLALVAALVGDDAVLELLESGMARELAGGTGAFGHALTRDALYQDVPWLRRRALHRRVAEALAVTGAAPLHVATHWAAAGDEARARGALISALESFAAACAHRDAARAGRMALDGWPDGDDPAGRLAVLERYAHCAELGGDLAESARAWREVIALRSADGAGRETAVAHSRLALVQELRGDREPATREREAAAALFAEAGLHEEEATERLVAAAHLQSAGDHAAAVTHARAATACADAADRLDLRVRALGLEGAALAKRGEFEAGLAAVRRGLSIALEHELTAEAADAYQRLGTVMETAADYRGAAGALESALSLCDTTAGEDGSGGLVLGCQACMAYVLRELGDWDRSADLCRELHADPGLSAGTKIVADGVLGSILAFRGDTRSGRRLIQATLDVGRRLKIVSMTADALGAFVWLADAEGDADGVRTHGRMLLERWSDSEDRHYAIWALRCAAASFAGVGEAESTRACAEALAQVAGDTGHPDALAALAHALAECALLEGDAETAADQLGRALDLHRDLEIPFERAQIALRAGVASAAAGERETAMTQFADAHRTARRLGARPLARRVAAEVAALGESLDERLGRRAAAEHEGAGLTRRELEVMRLVAVGMTNKQIAHDLVLSTRTVDMHVRSILAKLDCHSRVEATSRAHALGLVA